MKRGLLVFAGVASLALLALVSFGLASRAARAQSPAGDLLALINNTRLSQGLYPYALSVELSAAAQRHSNDMAETGVIDYTGSDGSSSTQRILEAGYGVYEFGLLSSENIYAGTGGAEVPFYAWMELPGARSNLLHEQYREVGIGVANDAQGRTFWTLDVGAQPNVLPVLVNEGAPSVDSITVTLRFLPENVVPEGRGTAMGQPVEYRASTSAQFLEAGWAPWAPQVTFVLSDTPGLQTVYVQLRDTAGRTTVSQDAVQLIDPNATVTPTETTTIPPSYTPEGTATTAVVTGTAAATATATGTAEVQASATATQTLPPSLTPSGTPSASPTRTGTPTPTPTTPATAAVAASATPSRVPTTTPSPTPVPTSAPPTPTTPPPTPILTPSSPPPSPVAVEPIAPPRAPVEEGVGEEVSQAPSEPPDLVSRLVPWAVGLQVIALVLGVYVALRRPDPDAKTDRHEP